MHWRSKLKFSLFTSSLVGFSGGVLFGSYDVGIHLIKENTLLVQPIDILSFSLYPVIFSAILGWAGMIFFAIIAFFSLETGEVKLGRKKLFLSTWDCLFY